MVFLPGKNLLVNDLGKLYAKFVERIFSGFFNCKYDRAVRTDIVGDPAALTADRIKNYDILLATVPNFPISHPHPILISDSPSRENFPAVYQAVFH